MYVLYANSKHPGLPQHLRDDMMPYISEPAKHSVRCTVVILIQVKIPGTVSTSTSCPHQNEKWRPPEMKALNICDDNTIAQRPS
jgi:hypothetical protein